VIHFAHSQINPALDEELEAVRVIATNGRLPQQERNLAYPQGMRLMNLIEFVAELGVIAFFRDPENIQAISHIAGHGEFLTEAAFEGLLSSRHRSSLKMQIRGLVNFDDIGYFAATPLAWLYQDKGPIDIAKLMTLDLGSFRNELVARLGADEVDLIWNRFEKELKDLADSGFWMLHRFDQLREG
jgi:hypothetical protein